MKKSEFKQFIKESLDSILTENELSSDEAVQKLTTALEKINIPGLGLETHPALYRALAKAIVNDLKEMGISLTSAGMAEAEDPAQSAFNKALEKRGVEFGKSEAGNVMGFSLEKLQGYDELPDTMDEESYKTSLSVPAVDGIGNEILRSKERAKLYIQRFQDKWGVTPRFKSKTDHKIINNKKYTEYVDAFNAAAGSDYGKSGGYSGD